MADDIFARTMKACLESKKTASTKLADKKPAVKKVVTEAKTTKKVAKKPVAKKGFYESKGTKMFMEDDYDAEQAELDAYEADALDDNDIVDDVEDDIIVVVDPELDEDEISETALDAQEIIDNTDEGEIPSTDEYVGDFTYTCPICGNTFFSANELGAGDACPVCGDTPDDFVLVGEVAETEEMADEAPVEDEIIDDEIIDEVPAEDEEAVDEDVEVDVAVSDDIIDEDVEVDVAVDTDTDEVNVDVDPDTEELELDVDLPAEAPVEDEFVECGAKKAVRRSLDLDESTFNPFLTKFIRENYKNARSLTVKKASLRNNKLTLECKLTFKSGNSKKVVLRTEGFKRNGAFIVGVKDDGTFKVESKKVAPIKMRLNVSRGIVKCEGMKYDFMTVCEGRRARVMSAPVMESRKAPVRKPVAKRVVRK